MKVLRGCKRNAATATTSAFGAELSGKTRRRSDNERLLFSILAPVNTLQGGGAVSFWRADKLWPRLSDAPPPPQPDTRQGLMTWKGWRSLHIWTAPPEWPRDVFWEPTNAPVCVSGFGGCVSGASLRDGLSDWDGPGASGPGPE